MDQLGKEKKTEAVIHLMLNMEHVNACFPFQPTTILTIVSYYLHQSILDILQ